jgi:electron transfer flavoprotein alpha subunit
MADIFVVVEHRKGEVRDITFEMLFKASEMCRESSHGLTAILLGGRDTAFLDDIAQWADRIIAFEDERLENYNPDLYKEILHRLIREHRPFLTLIGHTSFGMGFAPALSVKAGYPIATDCIDILIDNGRPMVTRQIYSGKVFSKVSFRKSEGYIITLRQATCTPEKTEVRRGEVFKNELPPGLPEPRQEFVEFVEAGAGEVDISQADLLVSIGRGIGEEENVEAVKELADLLGGMISCSRPVVDKNWLPSYHQVGTSGKSVKPKVYLALGISGAFQHVAGIAGAGTVIAVNKDKKAPIFRIADYGVVDDLFKVVEALKVKLAD